MRTAIAYVETDPPGPPRIIRDVESTLTAGAPERAPADAALEIVSLHWERVQVVIRARRGSLGPDDGRRFRLERAGGHGPSMPPTRAWSEGDDLLLRFNVMQGPDQDPLTPGRWTLTIVAADGRGRAGADPDRRCRPPWIPSATPAASPSPTGRPGRCSGSSPGSTGRRARSRWWSRSSRRARRTSLRARARAFRWAVVDGLRGARAAGFRQVIGIARHVVAAERPADPVHLRLASRALRQPQARLRPHGRARARPRVRAAHALPIEHRGPSQPARPPAAAVPARGRGRHRHRRLPAGHLPDRGRPGRCGSSSCGTRRVRSRPSGTAGSARRADRARGRGPTRTTRTRSSAPRTTCRSTRRRSGSPSRASSRPGSRGWTGSSTDGDAPPVGRRRSAAFPMIARPVDDPVRADLPRRRGPGRLLRPQRGSTTPRSTRSPSSGTRSSSSGCTRSSGRRSTIPEAFADRLVDGIGLADRRQRPALHRRPARSPTTRRSSSSTRRSARPMLFYAYDLEEYIASRDFYEPFETFVPGRIVRTFEELLDAIRREDFEIEKVAPVRGAPLRPPRRSRRPTGSSTS